MTSSPPLLEARGLTKLITVRGPRAAGRRRAPDRIVHAVEDVSLTLQQRHVTAVVGPTGSGKSTLARLIAGLDVPTSGRLLLDGRTIRDGRYRPAQPTHVQMMSQDPFCDCDPQHDVRHHLAQPLLANGPTCAASLDESIAGLLERVALRPAASFLRKLPHELSPGQRQRVALAKALAARPQLLIADEPVSMLDVSLRPGMLNLLGDLRDRERLAVLYLTRDIASARYLADEIAIMYAGRIVETGPAEAVTDEPAHPYTRPLLSASPDPRRSERPVLRGHGGAPSPLAPPDGCRFHPRCPYAAALCTQQVPTAFDVGTAHASACWLADPARVSQLALAG